MIKYEKNTLMEEPCKDISCLKTFFARFVKMRNIIVKRNEINLKMGDCGKKIDVPIQNNKEIRYRLSKVPRGCKKSRTAFVEFLLTNWDALIFGILILISFPSFYPK